MKNLKHLLYELNEVDETDIILGERNETKEEIMNCYKKKISKIIEDDNLDDLESLNIIDKLLEELLIKIEK